MYSACRFRLVIRIRVPANVSTCLLEIVVLGSKTNISEAVGNAFGINRHATNKEGIIGQGFRERSFSYSILRETESGPLLSKGESIQRWLSITSIQFLGVRRP